MQCQKYCLFLKRAVFSIRRINATLTEVYYSSCASPGRHNEFSATATKPYSSSVHVSRSDGLCFSPRHIKTPAHVQAAAICCWWLITVTYFIFDPNPRNAEKQLLSYSDHHWLTLVQNIQINYQDTIWARSTLVCTAQNIRQLKHSFKVVPPLSPTTDDKKMTVSAQNNKSSKR